MSLGQGNEGVEGGLVRNPRKHKSNRRRALSYVQPKREKTWQEKRDEAEAARQRWAGVPPLVTAREMIAKANLSEETMAELSAAIAKLTPEKLEEIVNSGKLAEILAELTIGT